MSIQIVSIEGNIGSGKSTLLANLKKEFESDPYVVFLKEPVDEWNNIKDENGVTILEKFYGNQEKYSFSFQIMAYISRLKLLKNAVSEIKKTQSNDSKTKKFTIITERSLFTDKMVFAKMLYDSNKIEEINYQIYLNWFDAFADEFQVNKIIYVKADPKTCYERIKIRHRDGEDNIPIEYLQSCHNYHEKMMDKTSNECVCQEQLVLDGNNDIFKNEYVLTNWLHSIKNNLFN